VVVRDSEGVAGTIDAQALQENADQVVIAFDQDRRVQAPISLLRRREEGEYFVPLSFRELDKGTGSPERNSSGDVVAVVPVIHEEASVRRRVVETGRVRITKTVETVEETVDLPATHERVNVERVVVERMLDEPVSSYYEGDTLVIPVMEEVVVLQKKLMLREEIRVTKIREESQHQEVVTLQAEHVTVERDDALPSEGDRR
jgi:uncharacterized protein (TIGR02271 family)